jgi:hypothetical protein
MILWSENCVNTHEIKGWHDVNTVQYVHTVVHYLVYKYCSVLTSVDNTDILCSTDISTQYVNTAQYWRQWTVWHTVNTVQYISALLSIYCAVLTSVDGNDILCITVISITYILYIVQRANTVSTQYSTVQYSTVQYSTVQYSTVQYSTVQYSTVQYSTVQYSTVQYSTVQ